MPLRSSSCLGTNGHEMWHQICPPVCITSHIQPNAQLLKPAIFGSSCPRCFVDDPYLDVPCRSKAGRGPTNNQAGDSPHNVPTSNAFPNNVLTKVSPNIVQQIAHLHWVLKIDIWEAHISFSPVPFMGRLRAYRFHSPTSIAVKSQLHMHPGCRWLFLELRKHALCSTR